MYQDPFESQADFDAEVAACAAMEATDELFRGTAS
jgi:hypothetical protein